MLNVIVDTNPPTKDKISELHRKKHWKNHLRTLKKHRTTPNSSRLQRTILKTKPILRNKQ